MNTAQLGIRIPLHLNEQLASYVAQAGTSKTEVVIKALASYLESTEALPLEDRVTKLEERIAKLEKLVKAS